MIIQIGLIKFVVSKGPMLNICPAMVAMFYFRLTQKQICPSHMRVLRTRDLKFQPIRQLQ